jgi:hypothetical protein
MSEALRLCMQSRVAGSMLMQRKSTAADSAAKTCCIRQYSVAAAARAHCSAIQQYKRNTTLQLIQLCSALQYTALYTLPLRTHLHPTWIARVVNAATNSACGAPTGFERVHTHNHGTALRGRATRCARARPGFSPFGGRETNPMPAVRALKKRYGTSTEFGGRSKCPLSLGVRTSKGA